MALNKLKAWRVITEEARVSGFGRFGGEVLKVARPWSPDRTVYLGGIALRLHRQQATHQIVVLFTLFINISQKWLKGSSKGIAEHAQATCSWSRPQPAKVAFPGSFRGSRSSILRTSAVK